LQRRRRRTLRAGRRPDDTILLDAIERELAKSA
jgi:hypothetical protein